MAAPLRIGIAGLGTVGSGAFTLLREQAELLALRCGRPLKVVAVSARDKGKDRGINLDDVIWHNDPLDLAMDTSVDVVVEVMGGSEGPAREVVEKALLHGKSVVTANKALIAHHGLLLAQLAEEKGVVLAFEAAVAGGIPIIKALRDGLSANAFTRVAGILNGTCNYILTTMRNEKKDFAVVLEEAQRLGYAEADPSFDIDGVDTAHKLAILSSLAFGCPVDLAAVSVEGIRSITIRDIEFAAELGYRIKLLGTAQRTRNGILQRVHPAMVAKGSPLGSVEGVYNGVLVEGDAAGSLMFEGRGAGAGPTASSVVADIMDIARGIKYPPFAVATKALKALPASPMDELVTSYYLRLVVIDRPGVLAEVTSIFRDDNISMRSCLQHSHSPGEPVQIVLTTHETKESSMRKALQKITKLDSVTEVPHMIRIENL